MEFPNGADITVTFTPEEAATAYGTIDLNCTGASKSISLVTSIDSECFTEAKGNVTPNPRFLSLDGFTASFGTLPKIVTIAEGEDVKCGATCVKFEGDPSKCGLNRNSSITFAPGTYKINGWINTNGTFETGVYAANADISSDDPSAIAVDPSYVYFSIPDTKGAWHYFEFTFNVTNLVSKGTIWINNDSRSSTATLAYLDNWQIYNTANSDDEIIYGDYPIQPVSFNKVKFSDAFWAPRIKMNQEVTIPIALQQCEETGRIDNFKKAGGLISGYFSTEYTFDDTDIYKIIEGMAYSIQMYPNPELDTKMDELIGYIGAAQEEDGYLFTARTAAEPGKMHSWVGAKRWEKDPDLSHELYNCGHLYEAAVAHYSATGKSNLLDIAIKNADLLVKEFLEGGLTYEPGHQIVEMGLAKMYRVTDKKEYLELAKYFLDLRGDKGVARKEYSQTHKPVIYQDEAVGHAVRAVYMYSGMADVAAMAHTTSYLDAIDKIWENVAGKKYYITGGIGAKHDGEAFGANYELPNHSAYCETCAAIGNVYWNHRMFLLHGESKYYDVIERTLYNGLISGISLSGDHFFYPNPLESRGNDSRSEWFGCACCPSNLCRFTASIPGYVYAQKNDSIYINLFVQGESEIEIGENKVQLTQETSYPWDGNIAITVNPEKAEEFNLLIRIPGWVGTQPVPSDLYHYVDAVGNSASLKLNGKNISYGIIDGYMKLSRNWQKGDKLELEFPMDVHRTAAHESVAADKGKVSLERGPIVYCLEWPENGEDIFSTVIDDETFITPSSYDADFLNGVVSLEIEGKIAQTSSGEVILKDKLLTAIPYYAWANRGKGDMAVWVASSKEYAEALPEELPEADTLIYTVLQEPFTGSINSVYPTVTVEPDVERICEIFGLQLADIQSAFNTEITYAAVNPNGSLNTTSTANAPGHWFDNTGYVTSWGTNSYVFSEFKLSDFVFNIGQYPNICPDGSKYTLKQALTYSPVGKAPIRVVFVFNITVSSDPNSVDEMSDDKSIQLFTSDRELHINGLPQGAIVYIDDVAGGKFIQASSSQGSYSITLPSGVYIVSVGELIKKKIIIP